MRARVDLHIHSPAGGDYRGDAATSLDQIQERCRDIGLDLVVVADHMTLGGWSHLPLPAVQEPPVVLPGVEIKISHNGLKVHLVAILEPHTASATFAALRRRLSPFITRDKRLSEIEVVADPGFVFEGLQENKAICLAAHLDRLPHGARALRMLQVAGDVVAVEFDVVESSDLFCPNGLARVSSSDSHSLSEIGRRYTELKLDALTFEALSKALRAGASSVAGYGGN